MKTIWCIQSDTLNGYGELTAPFPCKQMKKSKQDGLLLKTETGCLTWADPSKCFPTELEAQIAYRTALLREITDAQAEVIHAEKRIGELQTAGI